MRLKVKAGDVNMVTTENTLELTSTCMVETGEDAAPFNEPPQAVKASCELRLEAEAGMPDVTFIVLLEEPVKFSIRKEQLAQFAAVVAEFDR
jgi:hypothetical protein